MRARRFAGYAIPCESCAHVTKAATLLVAQQLDLEHQVECDAKVQRVKDIAKALAAQGELFGGGS